MNELELLARLIPGLPTRSTVVVGAGDDCAVLDVGIPGRYLLFKTDAVVERVHFTLDVEPRRIGHKALARCLSDIAAMGGIATHALITIGLPNDFDSTVVEGIYEGINGLAARHDVAIAGGETTANPGHIFLSVSLLGEVEKERCVLRTGGKVGDALFVTGQLGGAMDGKHLDFEPRLVEARWLTEHFGIHAMIDISDGLARDLRHLMKASGVGAEVLATAVPLSRAARLRARAGVLDGIELPRDEAFKTALKCALTDGEDFELLFAIASRDAVPLLDGWKERFPDLPLSCVGKITAGPEVVIRDKQMVRPLLEDGYIHFA